MTVNVQLIRPLTLNIGEIYLFRERDIQGTHHSLATVTFVNYTPCPAIVIIKHNNGSKQRCLRDDLFESRSNSKYPAAGIELISVFRSHISYLFDHLSIVFQDLKTSLFHPANWSI